MNVRIMVHIRGKTARKGQGSIDRLTGEGGDDRSTMLGRSVDVRRTVASLCLFSTVSSLGINF